MPPSPPCSVCGSTHLELLPYGNHQRLRHRIWLSEVKGVAKKLRAILSEKSVGDHNSRLFEPIDQITRCQECGHGQYRQNFASGELESYYQRRYHLAEGLPVGQWDDIKYVMDHPKTTGQWEFTCEFLKDAGHLNMLDIGAAASRISRRAKYELGSRVECSVIEPGEGWWEYYRHHDIRLAGRFFPCPDTEQYAYIHTSHWLEHVADLSSVLSALRSRISKDGICFIEVPNCDTAYFDLDFPDVPHIHFFTSHSLKIAMESHQFETVKLIECALPNPRYLPYLRGSSALSATDRRQIQMAEAENEFIKGGNLLRGLFRAVA